MRTLSLLLLCWIVLFNATGQPGNLDPSFGKKGIQTTGFLTNANTLDEQGKVVLTSANGNIFIVVGVSSSYTRIAKYLPDGSLDSSYGNAGYSNNAMNLNVSSAVLQGDKIIVAGTTGNSRLDFALARYTADGTLDSSFGVNGKVTTDFSGNNDYASSIALQGDKILVGGGTYNPANSNADFAIVRYTTDGILDSSFGVNGKVTTDFGSSNDYASSIVLQGDKIIMAGHAYDIVNNNTDFALARYTTMGTLDSSFGEDGKVTTDFTGTYDEATSIALQGDKIVAGGYTYNTVDYFSDFALARYNTDGVLDSSFGVNGKVTTDFAPDDDVDSDDQAYSIALQGDKIILAGDSKGGFTLVRYTTDGALDSSFGVNGKVTSNFYRSGAYATSIALQGDKILVAGSIWSYYSNYDFALARYTGDGTLDASFGENGLLTGYFPESHAFFTSTVIQGDNIIAAGYVLSDRDKNDFALARYTADGTFDSSFGVNGIITTGFIRFSDDYAYSIALQGDKIIAAGSTYDFTTGINDFALARYTTDGRLDSSFGENGKVTTDFNNSSDAANSIAIQGDKIIAAGSTYDFTTGINYFALACYTANGKLDSSFGVNGKVTTDFNSLEDKANSIKLDGDKIVVGGYTYILNSGFDFALAQYTADGRLDSSFGVNGKVTTDFNNKLDEANAIALQGDKIIAGGFTDNPVNGIVDLALVRYSADGSVDSTFGVNGKVITDLDGTDYIQAIAIHENRLYAVGGLTFPTSHSDESYGVVAAYQLEDPELTEPMVSIEDVTVLESKKLAVVTVRLSAPANRLVRVDFTTWDITATAPQDYLDVKDSLLFNPGITTAKITISIINDSLYENDEQFEVFITKASNVAIQDSVGVVTILDDDNALPVDLTHFAARQQNNTVAVNWNVNNENDISAYDVEYCSDGIHYKTIDMVKATGMNAYYFIHNNPVAGANYYRLKIVDANGGFTYSNIAVVRLTSMLTVGPNPFFNYIKITTGAPASAVYSMLLYSASGQSLLQKIFSGNTSINTAALAAGTYLIKVESSDGGIQTFKLQKQYH